MASSRTFFLLSVTILCICSLASSIEESTVHKAAEILSDSGYISMSLTLQLLYPALLSNASVATIFSPSDDAFSDSGQPSFALVQIHFSPVAYSLDELRFLPFGSKIPTLSPSRSLTVTTRPSDDGVSIDFVRVDGSPIYNDGSLIVFTTANFFDLDFDLRNPSPQISPPNSGPNPSFESAPSISPDLSPNMETERLSPDLSPNMESERLSPNLSPRSEAPGTSTVCSPNLECPVRSGERSVAEGRVSMRSERLLHSLACIMVASLF